PELGDPGASRVVVPARIELATDPEHLPHREAAVERVLLRKEPDPRQHLGRIVVWVETENADGALTRTGQADCHPQQRRLTGAVRAYKRGDRAARDLERAIAQRPLRAVAPPEAVRLERGGHATLLTEPEPRCSERSASIACSSSPASRARPNQSRNE